jgi:hypothetical protein
MSQPAVEPVPPADADLIRAIRGGDTAAYASLYERHAAAAARATRSGRTC